METNEYTSSAQIYDIIYRHVVDYETEADAVSQIVRARCTDARSLVEFGSGTGLFLERFARDYDEVLGVDISEEMVAVCRKVRPDLDAVVGDLRTYRSTRNFDVVTCLFSSVSYVRTRDGLHEAMTNMAAHVAPGGVLIVDGWLRPEVVTDRFFSADVYEGTNDAGDAVAVSRSSFTRLFERDGDRYTDMEMAHIVASASGLSTFSERHVMGVWDDATVIGSMRAAGLVDVVVVEGWPGRGRFVGSRSADDS